MAKLSRGTACAVLASLGIQRGEDFHALSNSKIIDLATAAKSSGYRKPKSANGSRARYFHARLQRACR